MKCNHFGACTGPGIEHLGRMQGQGGVVIEQFIHENGNFAVSSLAKIALRTAAGLQSSLGRFIEFLVFRSVFRLFIDSRPS